MPTVSEILVIALSFSVTAAAGQAQDKPATPAEQYQALLKQYQQAAGGGAKSDEQRKKLIEKVRKLQDKLAREFLELAEKNPKDPVAVDALIQAVWMSSYSAHLSGGEDGPGAKAL